MLINACVKNRRTKILPQNRCPVALILKDGGGKGGGGGGGGGGEGGGGEGGC